MTDFWTSLSAFRFSRPEILWLIEVVLPLPVGEWPPEPSTGYEGHNKQRSYHANFEASCLITGEVRARLKLTGIEGKLLVAEVQGGKELEELQPESRRALNFVSGFRRRHQSYQSWKKQRAYRARR